VACKLIHLSVLARVLLCGICLFLLAACSEQALYSGLSEREANEMVSVLAIGGLESQKEADGNDSFSVTAATDDFAQAIRILSENGLPQQRYDTLGEVFAKEGFVSSPLEERARLNHALSQEIASTLSSIDGVLMARVHLAVPQRDDLSDSRTPSSASVFVKHRKGVKLDDKVSKIKALVVNGIENLPYENVTVALFEAGNATTRLESNSVEQTLQSMSDGQSMAAGGRTKETVEARFSSLMPAELLGNKASSFAGMLLILLAVVYFAIRHLRGRKTVATSNASAMTTHTEAPGGTDRAK